MTIVPLILSFFARTLQVVERDDVFFPLQIVLLPTLIMLAGMVWGGSS